MIEKFQKYHKSIVKIKDSIRKAWKARMNRLHDLYTFFDSELKMMITYYRDKAKNNKKLKPTLEGLMNL
jgi:hypothetical protein